MTFDSPDEADNAKEKVNGSVIDGRKIEVRRGVTLAERITRV